MTWQLDKTVNDACIPQPRTRLEWKEDGIHRINQHEEHSHAILGPPISTRMVLGRFSQPFFPPSYKYWCRAEVEISPTLQTGEIGPSVLERSAATPK
jgi:hypothetical protein